MDVPQWTEQFFYYIIRKICSAGNEFLKKTLVPLISEEQTGKRILSIQHNDDSLFPIQSRMRDLYGQ